MVVGIGIDIQEVKPIEKMIEKYGDRFINRIFTPEEISYCKRKSNYQSYAARWAVKEAFFKGLGTGITKQSQFKEVSVKLKANGKPEIHLTGSTKKYVQEENLSINVSISHSGDYAIGQVILSRKG